MKVAPAIGQSSQRITATSSVKDLETMLQLTYLYFTAPRRDSVAFEGLRNRTRSFLTNRSASPKVVYNDSLSAVLYGNNLRTAPATRQMVDRADYGRIMEIYRERFADASAFKTVIIGNVSIDSLRPLLCRYLAALVDEDGYLAYNNQLDALVDMTEKVNALYVNQGTYVFQGQAQDDIGYHFIIEKFAEGTGLMATTQFLSIETHIGPLSEFSYGIVPMPKLSKEQAEYKTYVQDQVSCFGISAAIADENRQSMLSAVMESIAYNSNEIVRPAYYENSLSLRFMNDPQSRNILNTMFETIAFDYTYATGIGDVRGTMRNLLPSKKTPAIASRVKGWERSISKVLEKDNAALDKLP